MHVGKVPLALSKCLSKSMGVFLCNSLDLCYDPCHVIKHESKRERKHIELKPIGFKGNLLVFFVSDFVS